MKLKKILFIILITCIMIIHCSPIFAVDISVESPTAILVNCNTGKIIYEKNGYGKTYPASTTKIMTAILTLETCNLSDMVTVSENATLIPSGYIHASLQVGEQISVNDLLYLLLLPSANDAAIVLAEHIAGSVASFANMMNSKAVEIGCLNTYFVNPNGIHDDNHYSTAYDLAIIGKYAMRNETFRNIVSCTKHVISATNCHEERIIYNTNKLLHPFINHEKNIYYYEYAIGLKTGYTTTAGNCLVSYAKKDNTEYVAVILGAPYLEDAYNSPRYSDTINLFEAAFNNYSLCTVKNSGDVITEIEIPNGFTLGKNLDLTIQNDINILMKIEDLNTEIPSEIKLYEEKLTAPIKKGDVLGTVTYTYDNITYTENIVASHSVPVKEKVNLYLQIFAGILVSIIVLKIFIK